VNVTINLVELVDEEEVGVEGEEEGVGEAKLARKSN